VNIMVVIAAPIDFGKRVYSGSEFIAHAFLLDSCATMLVTRRAGMSISLRLETLRFSYEHFMLRSTMFEPGKFQQST
jgi:hypothetical protein